MRKALRYIVKGLFFLFSLTLYAQKGALVFKHLTNSEGLSSNRINTIIDAVSKLLINSVIFIVSSVSLCISKLSANVSGLAVVAAIYKEFYYEMQRMKIRRIFF